ncbi:MAG: undecaprenyl-diphosphate phosphatase [Clostridia bacterium]
MHHLGAAIVAGIIEGVVEWLPVSSKTMITLYFALIGINVQSAYNLGLIANLGSFFAAIYYFRREAWEVLKSLPHPFAKDRYSTLLRFLFVGTLATGVTGIPIYLAVQKTFSIVSGSVAMLLIGVLLLITSFIARNKTRLEAAAAPAAGDRSPTLAAALVTGGMQGLAALPGISRSAMTMTPLLLMGFSAEESLRLSFMLDVIALVGAGVVPLVIGHGGLTAIHTLGTGTTIVMLVAAAIVSFLAINAVLGVARRLKTWIATLIIGIIALIFPLIALLVH